MAPVPTKLKKAFIAVDVIIGVLGAVWLVVLLFLHGAMHSQVEAEVMSAGAWAVSLMYAFGVVLVAMSAIGLYGILKKKQWPLIVLSVGVCVVILVLLVCSILFIHTLKMVKDLIVLHYGDMDLIKAHKELEEAFERIQKEAKCCGTTTGYSDWKGTIPVSCHCPTIMTSSMQCIPVTIEDEEVLVFGQPCLPVIIQSGQASLDLVIGVAVTYLLLSTLGLALACAVLCQMRKKTIAPPVSFTTHESDSKYSQLLA
ncbi:tetraspanin-8-like [Engraulis encrasicolus]|uniref:tetraspanin-8-like n=1 Tax=Engraulis encrasicolus TaxID=184585 RepID=UPI002FD689D6